MNRRSFFRALSALAALPILLTKLSAQTLSRLFAPDYPAYPERVGRDGVLTVDQYDVSRWQVEMRRTAARVLPDTGYSSCLCCHMPWWVVQGHMVDYAKGRGCFAVCEMCWHDLNRDEVWPYYKALIRRNNPGDTAKESELKKNVFAGSYLSSRPSSE